jgi:hypothetical protein
VESKLNAPLSLKANFLKWERLVLSGENYAILLSNNWREIR